MSDTLSITKAWGYSGPHGLFKRGKDSTDEDPEEEITRLLEEVTAQGRCQPDILSLHRREET